MAKTTLFPKAEKHVPQFDTITFPVSLTVYLVFIFVIKIKRGGRGLFRLWGPCRSISSSYSSHGLHGSHGLLLNIENYERNKKQKQMRYAAAAVRKGMT